jgi:hypothetical protein
MTRCRLILQWLAARDGGDGRCPLCGAAQGPALAGYAITEPHGSVDCVPVCETCAWRHSHDLILARDEANDAVADDAARLRWKIERGEAERIPEGTPMTIGERLDALDEVSHNLEDRQISVIDIDCSPTDHSELDEQIRRALENREVSPDKLCGVACVHIEDEGALRRGEEFGIYVSLPPSDDGRDAERRVRAVAAMVHQELFLARVPHTWDGGTLLWLGQRRAAARDS